MPNNIVAVDLILAFSQCKIKNKKSNGASIAILKASIEVFGIGKVVECQKTDETYRITLKNGFQLSFSEKELKQSTELCNFRLNAVDPGKISLYQSLFEYAQLLWCVMAKVVCEIDKALDKNTAFEEALKYLNQSPAVMDLPYFLGLENFFIGKSTLERIFMSSKNSGMVAWVKNHAVYVSEEIYDNNGKAAYKSNWSFLNKIKIVSYPVN